ncbi:phospholipase D-like domain-containing protein [Lacrimispora sp.]|uniref:phospholipase D-like domain-containing protein n=1 Tax=Lacrimispora sp. TaxID=2719234 RepID=UPI00289E86D5|nr:phospholipase D-like domain-containing protein [Lacrimispora sp.]
MQEKDFKKLLIDTIKVGDNGYKDEIVSLLRISDLQFEKTNVYTKNLWNHYKEYVNLYIVPQKMAELTIYKEYIFKICDDIYPSNDEYELWELRIKPGNGCLDEEVSQEILFKDIQNQIIEEIRNAKFLIWVAVAWFTDPVLFSELVKKKKEGLNIQVIIDENEKNNNASFRLEDEFDTYRISIESLYKNTMHHKFCVIDLVTSIHGSFNWTKAANYNKETISVDHNRETAERFASEFLRLKINKKIEWDR